MSNDEQTRVRRSLSDGDEPLGERSGAQEARGSSEIVWIKSAYPVLDLGFRQLFGEEFQVYFGEKPPESEKCDYVVLCTDDSGDALGGIEILQGITPEARVLVFSFNYDLNLAWETLQAGARGFLHGGMRPEQILRALQVVREGKIAAPRALLGFALKDHSTGNMNDLSNRQREVLHLVADGLSNSQAAQKLFLSESSIKQHLRSIYRVLGVRNRTEAARLFRDSG